MEKLQIKIPDLCYAKHMAEFLFVVVVVFLDHSVLNRTQFKTSHREEGFD